MTAPVDFDAATIIATLNQHGVHYVVIGALAAQLHGAPIPRTRDIDITPAATDDNLGRLSAALHDLGARIRTVDAPDGLPFDHTLCRGYPEGHSETRRIEEGRPLKEPGRSSTNELQQGATCPFPLPA